MTEISRLLAELTVEDKPSRSASALSGWPGFAFWNDDKRLEAVAVWAKAAPELMGDGGRDQVLCWIRTYLWLDIVVFAPAYVLVIYLLLRKIWGAIRKDPPFPPEWIKWLVLGVLAADWAETIFSFRLVGDLPAEPSEGWADAVAFFSSVKWGALAVTVLFGLLGFARMLPGPLDEWLDRWMSSTLTEARVWTRHRNQLGVLLILVLLVVVPGEGPLEQLPDIERAWALHGWGQLVGDVLGPVVVLFGFCLALWVVGRWALLDGAPQQRQKPWLSPLWLLTLGGILLLLALLLHLVAGYAAPGVYAVPVLVLVLAIWSLFLRGEWQDPPAKPTRIPNASTRERARSMGRVLAVLPLAIAGLGLTRAYARPYLLGSEIATGVGEAGRLVDFGRVEFWFWIGVAAAALAGPVANEVVRFLEGRWLDPKAQTEAETEPKPEPDSESDSSQRPMPTSVKVLNILGLGMLALAVVTGGALTMWPGMLGPLLRSLGVLVLLLTTVTLAAGWLARRAEYRLPLPALRYLRFRLTPLWLLVIAALVLEAMLDTTGGYHEVRLKPRPASDGALAKPFDAKQSFKDWHAAVKKCMDDDAKLKTATAMPMLFIAAPGGGIRAAYWTGSAMDELTKPPCARDMVFGASGVSGGSLGLVGHGLGPRENEPAEHAGRDFAARLSGEDTLAANLAAMFYRDLPRALHGINTLGDLRPGDRAIVFERSWESLDDRLKGEFFSATSQPANGSAWRPLILLNGTDVNSGCRVVVSRVWATGGPTDDDQSALNCQRTEVATPRGAGDRDAGPPGFAAGAIDAAAYTDHRDCNDNEGNQGLRLATAVHLSARFPFISPSGRMHRCVKDGEPQKLADLDGGTLESSGLALLLELWEELEPQVAAYNKTIATGSGGRYVLPLVAVLDNHYQSGGVAPRAKRQPEAVAPLTASKSPKAALSVTTLGQLALYRFSGPLPGTIAPPIEPQKTSEQPGTKPLTDSGPLKFKVDGAECPQLRSFFAAPSSRPGIAAPLGWVLSDMSRGDLKGQLAKLVKGPHECQPSTELPPGQTPGSFSTLLKLLRGPVTVDTQQPRQPR
ncbi:hypothetical protein [Streptomyces katrae]|uniref:hypothetical protein n=1 Tax=Streptomyces katrae TaxID=68223 RepID=UPI00131B33E6|nr:hypothetical protein [Streptomyces katrae]